MTSRPPASPNARSTIAARIAASASAMVVGNHDALARGQTIGLDHDRQAKPAAVYGVDCLIELVADNELSRGIA